VQNGKKIAVKLLHPTQRDCEEEFTKEFENLRGLKHPNIVQLLGYCYEIKHEYVEYKGISVLADKIYRALCFEFMDNGSLQEHLDGKI
jgi:serine/threonine protein kinase